VTQKKGVLHSCISKKENFFFNRFPAGVDLIIEVETFVKKNKLGKPVPGHPGAKVLSDVMCGSYIKTVARQVDFDFLSLLNRN